MDIVIRMAEPSDLEAITSLMDYGNQHIARPEWFVADDREYIAEHISIENTGFVLVAEGHSDKSHKSEVAGFFMIDLPGRAEKNLGWDVGLSAEECEKAAIMDSVVVAEKWRGHGLQGKMLREAEVELIRRGYRYFLATVHPDNAYSLNNMLRAGYEIKATKEKYGGKLRHVLLKEIEDEGSKAVKSSNL